jgi:hypothetical protein
MRTLILTAAVLIAAVGLPAPDQRGPAQTVEKFLNALSTQDFAFIRAVFTQDSVHDCHLARRPVVERTFGRGPDNASLRKQRTVTRMHVGPEGAGARIDGNGLDAVRFLSRR